MAAERDMPLDLRALEVFVAVCESGAMTRAARRLGTSQPATSQTIAQLERTLGTPLLERHGRPLVPTAAGEVLLDRARGLLNDALAAREAVRGAGAQTLPLLRLGLVDSFAMTVGPALIQSLQRDAEEVRVWSGLTRQLESGLLARELDLLVSAEPLDELSGVDSHRLFLEPFVLALPRDVDARRANDLQSLADALPLVRYSLRSVTGMQVERYLRRCGVRSARRMEFDGSESVLAMVQSGIGWALTTPLCLLQGHADFARLTLRALPAPAPRRALYLVARKDFDPARRETLMRRMRRLMRARIRAAAPALSAAASDIAYE